MIEVLFEREGNRYSGIFATGHAGWADIGSDVVCASVSAVLQAAWLGLTDHAQVMLSGTRSSGALKAWWDPRESDRPSVTAIVATAELAIAQIARQYPDHVRIVAAEEKT